VVGSGRASGSGRESGSGSKGETGEEYRTRVMYGELGQWRDSYSGGGMEVEVTGNMEVEARGEKREYRIIVVYGEQEQRRVLFSGSGTRNGSKR